jgi:hypothetical protein
MDERRTDADGDPIFSDREVGDIVTANTRRMCEDVGAFYRSLSEPSDADRIVLALAAARTAKQAADVGEHRTACMFLADIISQLERVKL